MAEKFSYTLGLDIGMASVGAALLGQERILGLHVRAFDKAEDPKTGESLGKTWREAKGTRRRLRRRAFRLLRLRRLLKRAGLISSTELPSAQLSPWQLRADALQRALSNTELAQVIYHIIKHRGFQSNRKSEIQEDEKLGQMLSGVQANRALLDSLQAKGIHTVGAMAHLQHGPFQQAKRNKAGAYLRTFSRADLQEELQLIFTQQRENFGQSAASAELYQACEALLLARQPTLSGENLLKMLGKCTFEPNQYRAPKASYSAEQFVWLTKLNNLRIVSQGEKRTLSETERAQALELPFELSSLKYKQLRKKWGLAEHERFAGLSYRLGGKDPEDSVLFEAKGFHTLKKIYEAAASKQAWQQARLEATPLDTLAYALTCFKDDQESRAYLLAQGFTPELVEKALEASFSDFIRISNKALQKILPFMRAGQRYDEAVLAAGYQHHSDLNQDAPKQRRLAKLERADFPNPVVFRALNQARKLLNAIIDEYGPPQAVHIELARDLAKSFDERKKISKAQDEFRVEKEKAAQRFIEQFGRQAVAKTQDLLKMRLYHEQDGQCAYSQKGLDIHRLFNAGYAEIDHALPYSRSFDDSQNNKVLVLLEENRNKGNRTPCEYLGGPESPRWQAFVAWVNANKKLRLAKKQRLLRLHFGPEESAEFKERNLNDTRYICRTFKTQIENQLQLAPNEADGKQRQRCVVLSGQLTAMLRARWGFLKVRENGDLHHALDAAVIAACSAGMVQQVGRWARSGEMKQVAQSYTDPETGEIVQAVLHVAEFPMPWPHFRQELKAWLSDDPATGLAGLPGYAAQVKIAPVRVSRAPQRRGLGEAHQATIRSRNCPKDEKGKPQSAVKTPLADLKLKDLDNIVGAHDPRNAQWMEILRTRLEAHGGDGKKAFAEAVYKPSAEGKTAPLIRSVKLLDTQQSGIPVRGGVANNGGMLRVDIFSKKGKYFAVPLYVSDVGKPLPMHAATKGKLEADWPLMDESHTFCFSLHPNDWVVLRYDMDGTNKEGYYNGFDRSSATLKVWVHDRDRTKGEKGLMRGLGIKTLASIEKYHVDVLGRIYRARQETRQPLRVVKEKE